MFDHAETETERLAARIARHIPMLLPWSDMSAILTGRQFRDDMSVRDVINSIMEPEVDDMLRKILFSAREEGLLPEVLENDIESPWIKSWNAWQENTETPEDLRVLTSPLRAVVLSELAWAATPGRYRSGDLREDHLEAPLSRDTFESRIRDAMPRLQDALAKGTSADWHEGHLEMIGKRKQRRIVLEGWAPHIQERGGFTVPWEPRKKIAEAEPDVAPDMGM